MESVQCFDVLDKNVNLSECKPSFKPRYRRKSPLLFFSATIHFNVLLFSLSLSAERIASRSSLAAIPQRLSGVKFDCTYKVAKAQKSCACVALWDFRFSMFSI